MKRPLLALIAGTFGVIAVSNARDVEYRWQHGFHQGYTASVRSKDGQVVFDFHCVGSIGTTMEMGINIILTNGNPPPVLRGDHDVQIVVDDESYPASITDGFGTASTNQDQQNILNAAEALSKTKSPYFLIEIPDANWSREFSTAGARSELFIKHTDNTPPENMFDV